MLRKIQIRVSVYQAHSLNSKMIFPRFVCFLASLVLVAEAGTLYVRRHPKEHSLHGEIHTDNNRHKRDVTNEDKGSDKPKLTTQPPSIQPAVLARYIVNQADWCAISTISTRTEIIGYPTAGLISYSDGALGSGSGIPYFYLTPRDFIAIDLNEDRRATLFMSLAQGQDCKRQELDPMDPRCARIILTGTVKAVPNESAEYQPASEAFFGRHPKLVGMFPLSHHFFLAKLEIVSIAVMGASRGPRNVTSEEYLNVPVKSVTDGLITLSG